MLRNLFVEYLRARSFFIILLYIAAYIQNVHFYYYVQKIKSRAIVKTYTLAQTRNQHGEVFDKATVEPVLITKQKRPSHVILSADAYQRLIDRLEELEDSNLGKAAETALNRSSIVESDEFAATLKKLSNG